MSRLSLRSANLFLAGVFAGLCLSALLLRLRTPPPAPVPVDSTAAETAAAGSGPFLMLAGGTPDPYPPPPQPAAAARQYAASQPPPSQPPPSLLAQRQNAQTIALMQPAHNPEDPIVDPQRDSRAIAAAPAAEIQHNLEPKPAPLAPDEKPNQALLEGHGLLNVPHEAYLTQRGGPQGPFVPTQELPHAVRLPRACCSSATEGCLRTWIQETEPIAFIHIGKAGGTMFDQASRSATSAAS
jgi:hypothetical protein